MDYIVPSKYRGTKEYHLVYCQLITAAQHRGTVGYERVARTLGIPPTGREMIQEVGQVLGEISEDENRLGRPMLGAVAAREPGEAGRAFFQLARLLNKFTGTDSREEQDFWLDERKSVYDSWKVEV